MAKGVRLRRRFAAILARARFEDDLREELQSHLAHRVDDLMARGLRREEAERAARIEFGALERYKEQCRDSRGFAPARVTHGLLVDVKLAVRRLRAAPFFLLFAVLSLGIGLGVTVTASAVIESVFWRPLGVGDPNTVAVVTVPFRGERVRRRFTTEDFTHLRATQRSFAGVAASSTFTLTLATSAGHEPVYGESVSGGFFEVLGIPPALGRSIQPLDDARGAPVIVLSDRFWRTRFSRDPGAIGRSVRLGGRPFEIVGVAPAAFTGLSGGYPIDLWIPLGADPEPGSVSLFGRLSDRHTMRSAGAEMAVIGGQRNWSAEAIGRDDNEGLPLGVLLIVIVGLVLLVACTNLANLMLARGTMRQHDVAVRRALGASRWRLVREQSIEAGVIAVLGAAAAAGVTKTLLAWLPAGLPDNGSTFPLDPIVSPTVLAVGVAALLVALMTFGLEPAMQVTRTIVTSDLAGESGAVGVPRSNRQRTFIRWQVAVCTCLFLITAVLARIVLDVGRRDSGVDLDRLAIATISGMSDWDEARVRRAVDRVLDTARREAGIESVAISAGFPFGITSDVVALRTPERPFDAGRREQMTDTLIAATPDLFRTIGTPLVAGRAFTPRDDAASARVAIVSESTARRMLGAGDVVGRELLMRYGSTVSAVTIVGVVADTDSQSIGSRSTTFGVVYLPFAQHYRDSRWYRSHLLAVARTSGSPAAAARALESALRETDPTLAANAVGPASTLLAGWYVTARLAGTGAAALALLTLLLAMAGLYGVQSHIVAHRTREVGVRVALGATGRQIARLLLIDGFRPVGQGIAIGLALGIVARLAIRVMLAARIDPIETVACLAAPLPLVIAAYLACKIPAYRAARADPTIALRHP